MHGNSALPSGVLCEDPGMTIKKVYVLIAIMQKSSA
jgi:hypothetical protein